MRFLIDNGDGAGLRDYTQYVDADHSPRITRRLNRSARLELSLMCADASLVVPAADARVKVERADGATLFTGYVVAEPRTTSLATVNAARRTGTLCRQPVMSICSIAIRCRRVRLSCSGPPGRSFASLRKRQRRAR